MDPLDVVKGALPPIVAALLLVGLAGARWLPSAVALGVFVAHWLLKGLPPWPHELWSAPEGRAWLLWGVVAGALLAQLEALQAIRGRFAELAGGVAALAAVWFLLQKQAARWPAGDVVLFVEVGGIGVALLVLACRRAIATAPAGVPTAVVFSLLLAVDAGLVAWQGAATFGQLCGAAAAALGAGAATNVWRKPFALTPADGTWIGLAHGLFVLAGVHLGSLPWSAAGCALVAPCGLLLLRPGMRSGAHTALAVLLLAIPLGGAIWFVLPA
ncbi:MAG: hypothetical protein JNK15_09645 [Planctomycetes bacterium]|nr:hypothetical protein [Planctomycetota bacterium]